MRARVGRRSVADAPRGRSMLDMPPDRAERPHVLVVDDDREHLHMIERFLQSHFHVTLADSAEEAARHLQAAPLPDAIVTDLQMPGTDGADFIRWLRAQETLRNIPVVALSGSRRPRIVTDSINAGAKAFLEKPVRSERLVALLERLVRRP